MPVLGICNGFQVLCEAGLLPGALTRNSAPALPQPRPGAARRAGRHRLDRRLRAGPADRHPGQERRGPLRGGRRTTWTASRREGRVVFRYVDGNPNGSSRDIAGVTSENGRVVGLMPHPEHAVEELTGPSTDGLGFFTSVLSAVVAA